MTVDTSEKTYSLKLFLFCINKKTQLYESRAGEWSSRSPYLVKIPASLTDSSTLATCMSSNGRLYFIQVPQEIGVQCTKHVRVCVSAQKGY